MNKLLNFYCNLSDSTKFCLM